jgi:xanthine dehydrogenase YagR molybdenum-binding subunit
MGTASWSSAIVKACRAYRAGHEDEVVVDTREDVEADEPLSKHAFGAQFVEVRVNRDTGEIRVPRALGVFAAGRIINPKTARSQLIGGMTMGLGMALLEESVLDPTFGDYITRDLASYHVPSCADVGEIEAIWIDEYDSHVSPVGAKGIGEIGIVGTAAAVANAVHHATGIRLRSLPLRPDRVLTALS